MDPGYESMPEYLLLELAKKRFRKNLSTIDFVYKHSGDGRDYYPKSGGPPLSSTEYRAALLRKADLEDPGWLEATREAGKWPPNLDSLNRDQILFISWHYGISFPESYSLTTKGIQLIWIVLMPNYRPWTSEQLEDILGDWRNLQSVLENLKLEHPEDIPHISEEDIRYIWRSIYSQPELSFKSLIDEVTRKAWAQDPTRHKLEVRILRSEHIEEIITMNLVWENSKPKKHEEKYDETYPPSNWVTLPVHPYSLVLLNINLYTPREIMYIFGDIFTADPSIDWDFAVDVESLISQRRSHREGSGRNIANIFTRDPNNLRFYRKLETVIFHGYFFGGEVDPMEYIPPFYGTEWFVPVIRNHSENSLTILEYEEVSNVNIPMLAFGNPGGYYTYTFPDLIRVFSLNPGRYPHPEDPRETFSEEEVEDLSLILKDFPSHPEVDSLEGLIDARRSIEEVLSEEIFSSLEVRDRGIMKKLLHTIFDAGMYMRRWRGPGFPYPLLESQTQGAACDDRAIPLLVTIQEKVDRLSKENLEAYYSLRIYDYRQGKFFLDPYLSSLSELVRNVSDSRYCIRMASRRLILTAYYYLQKLADPDLPKLDLGKLQSIQ